MAKDRGYAAMITMQSWMFLGSFEKMRSALIEDKSILSMLHLGPRAFDAIGGEVVNVTADVVYNGRAACGGAYVRLVDINGSDAKRKKALEAIRNPDCGWFYRRDAETFKQIPGTPIAYWASDSMLASFSVATKLKDMSRPHIGIQTGDNARFIRSWWEVSRSVTNCSTRDEAISMKWFPVWKGGAFRKWYGNLEEVVEWENDGKNIIGNAEAEHRRVMDLPKEMKLCQTVCWSMISSGRPSFRWLPEGGLVEHASSGFFDARISLAIVAAFCNSCVATSMLDLISPTLNYEVSKIGALPLADGVEGNVSIDLLAKQSVDLSRQDWDSFETSWDFKHHPLL